MLRFFEFNEVKVKEEPEETVAITEMLFAEPINVIEETTSLTNLEVKRKLSNDSWNDDWYEVDDEPLVPKIDPSLVPEIDQSLKSKEDPIPEEIEDSQPKPKVKKEKSEHQKYRFKDQFQCFLCFTVFSSRKEKLTHVWTQHKKKNRCPCCVRPAFYSVSQYESHMRQHICGRYDKPSPNRKFTCDLCGIQKQRLYYLEIHLKEHAAAIQTIRMNSEVPAVASAYPEPKFGPSRKKRFVCKECEMKFETRFKWFHHYYDMHSSLICRYCKLTFDDEMALKQHMNEQHANGQPYTCEVCWKVLSSWVRFELHQRYHKTSYRIARAKTNAERMRTIETKNYECYICREKFTKNTLRMLHINKDHAAFKHVDCQLCSRKNIKSPAAYEMHMKFHELGFSATCPICGKQFYSLHRMTSHVSIAHEQKEAICDKCGLRTTRYKIRQHMRVKHLARVLFNCHLCVCKPFNTEISLQVHMSRKHGVSPLFNCVICGKGINYEQALKNHEMKCAKRMEKKGVKPNRSQLAGSSRKQSQVF